MFTNLELMNEAEKLEKFAYKLTKTKHDAEDLLQSTLLKSIEKKHMFNEGTNLFSWTSKIMYNMFVSSYRRKTKFETQYDPESYIERESIEASQDVQMEMQDVNNAMNTLPEGHKDILVMVCVKGMAYEEVAKTLNIPIGTVRSRLSRARNGLQAAMEAPRVSEQHPHARAPDLMQIAA